MKKLLFTIAVLSILSVGGITAHAESVWVWHNAVLEVTGTDADGNPTKFMTPAGEITKDGNKWYMVDSGQEVFPPEKQERGESSESTESSETETSTTITEGSSDTVSTAETGSTDTTGTTETGTTETGTDVTGTTSTDAISDGAGTGTSTENATDGTTGTNENISSEVRPAPKTTGTGTSATETSETTSDTVKASKDGRLKEIPKLGTKNNTVLSIVGVLLLMFSFYLFTIKVWKNKK